MKEEEELEEVPQDVAVVDEQEEEECYILLCIGKPVGKCGTCSLVLCERHAKWSQDRLHVACCLAHLPPPGSLPPQALHLLHLPHYQLLREVRPSKGWGQYIQTLARLQRTAVLERRHVEYQASLLPPPPALRSLGDIAAEGNARLGLDPHPRVPLPRQDLSNSISSSSSISNSSSSSDSSSTSRSDSGSTESPL